MQLHSFINIVAQSGHQRMDWAGLHYRSSQPKSSDTGIPDGFKVINTYKNCHALTLNYMVIFGGVPTIAGLRIIERDLLKSHTNNGP